MNLFGQYLRFLRRVSGKTIMDIVSKSGFSKSYLMDLESGRSYPNTNKIRSLCSVLEMPEQIQNMTYFLIADKEKCVLKCSKHNMQQLKTATDLVMLWEQISDDDLKRISKIIKNDY